MSDSVTPIEQLSQVLNNLKSSTSYLSIPESGWLYKIRTTCNIPLKFIAKKLGVTVEAIKAYEKSESLDSEKKRKISIATLEKVAAAMDMKLIYFLVPNNEITLLDTINDKLIEFEAERNSTKNSGDNFTITKPPSLYYKDIPKSIWDDPKPKSNHKHKTIDLSSLVKPPSQNIPD